MTGGDARRRADRTIESAPQDADVMTVMVTVPLHPDLRDMWDRRAAAAAASPRRMRRLHRARAATSVAMIYTGLFTTGFSLAAIYQSLPK